jgi:hypothetical protein
MSRHPSGAVPFRPCLERLEGRELPSGTGFLLFLFAQGLQQEVNSAKGQYTTLQNAVNAEVAAQSFSGPTNSVESAAPAVNGDLGVLSSLFHSLQGNVPFNGFFFSYALASGTLDSGDGLAVLFAFGALNNANQVVNGMPGQVSALGQQTLQFFPAFTVNSAQQFYNFPAVTL